MLRRVPEALSAIAVRQPASTSAKCSVQQEGKGAFCRKDEPLLCEPMVSSYFLNLSEASRLQARFYGEPHRGSS
jgi:hypothetical protein